MYFFNVCVFVSIINLCVLAVVMSLLDLLTYEQEAVFLTGTTQHVHLLMGCVTEVVHLAIFL